MATTSTSNAATGAASQSNGAPIQSLDQSIGNRVWVLLKVSVVIEERLQGLQRDRSELSIDAWAK